MQLPSKMLFHLVCRGECLSAGVAAAVAAFQSYCQTMHFRAWSRAAPVLLPLGQIARFEPTEMRSILSACLRLSGKEDQPAQSAVEGHPLCRPVVVQDQFLHCA